MPSTRCTRRTVLGLLAGVVGLAGCAGEEGDGDASPSNAGTTTRASTATTATDLDLREANVVDVAVESGSDGHRFDVTLYHDDDGEAGYANWWQVETLDGERLGRRDLAHPHGTRRFTRSATVSVPEGTTCVVVRGHDRTHGYGGQATLVNVETGATDPISQGSERGSVAGRECPGE